MRVYLDFETYYNRKDKYALGGRKGQKGMSIEEYVRDPRFKALGLGIAIDDNEPFYMTGQKIPQAIKAIDWSRAEVISHNLAFDGAILCWRYGVTAKRYSCTRSLAGMVDGVAVSASLKDAGPRHGVGEKILGVLEGMDGVLVPTTDQVIEMGEYCKQDVRVCRGLYQALRDRVTDDDLIAMDAVLRMSLHPRILLDKAKLDDIIAEEQGRSAQLLGSMAPERQAALRKIVRSTPKLKAQLENLGVTVPMKQNDKEEWIPAFAKTDKEFLALQQHPNPVVRTLLQLRLGENSNINTSRATKLRAIADRGPWPIELAMGGTIAGRLAGRGGTNPQNLPKHGDTRLRKCLLAPAGHKFVLGDLSQIEMRDGAWLAGVAKLLAAMSRGEDVYCSLVAPVVGYPVIKGEHDAERQKGKILSLAAQFGQSEDTFVKWCELNAPDLDEATARDLHRKFRAAYPEYQRAWRGFDRLLREGTGVHCGLVFHKGRLQLPSGREIVYPELHLRDMADRKGNVRPTWCYVSLTPTVGAVKREDGRFDNPLYGSKMFQNATQGIAFDTQAYILARFRRAVPDEMAQPVMQVHDELAFMVPDKHVEAVQAQLYAMMTDPPPWAHDCVLEAEVASGTVYGEIK